jgi:hypothetical protein
MLRHGTVAEAIVVAVAADEAGGADVAAAVGVGADVAVVVADGAVGVGMVREFTFGSTSPSKH